MLTSMLTPAVSSGKWTNETLTAALKAHITGEVTHYKGQCYAWDVVNEALNDNGTLRDDIFLSTIGESYIQIAFETAAAADPAAKLYYNDFGIETPGVKSTAAQNIANKLKAAGVRIDGVGFQSHFIVGGTPSMATQVKNLQAYTALGLEIAITELDIRMKLPSTTALLNQQSTDYQTTVGACVAVVGCVGVTVWDFDDKVRNSIRANSLHNNRNSSLGFLLPSKEWALLISLTLRLQGSQHILVRHLLEQLRL
jgi:endo-1,4-beta-xylanase